jgi:hypothetical protein
LLNRYSITAIFGVTGICLGWLTRPASDATGTTSLTFHQLYSQAFGTPEAGLAGETQATLLHVGLFFLSCALLGYVAARLSHRY